MKKISKKILLFLTIIIICNIYFSNILYAVNNDDLLINSFENISNNYLVENEPNINSESAFLIEPISRKCTL